VDEIISDDYDTRMSNSHEYVFYILNLDYKDFESATYSYSKFAPIIHPKEDHIGSLGTVESECTFSSNIGDVSFR
jgi:hypothetical protein